MAGRVGSHQGCCKHLTNAQDSSPQVRVIYSQTRTVLRLRNIAVNAHPIHLSYIDDIVFTCLLCPKSKSFLSLNRRVEIEKSPLRILPIDQVDRLRACLYPLS